MDRLYDEILKDVESEDGLVVLGHGLGAPLVLYKFVRSVLRNAEKGKIVLSLNVGPSLAGEFSASGIEDVHGDDRKLPLVISSDFSVADRKEVYSAGGFLATTSRILVHDFLREVIPAENVLGIVVNDAHKVHEATAEAFVLRLYRKVNKTGFIKGFTEEAETLRRGFHNAEKVMRSLYVKRLFLWPRFHESVQDVLDLRPVEVVEFLQPMTINMLALQQSIIETIALVLDEIKKGNKSIDITDFKPEDALYRSIADLVKNQLEPVWHMVGSRTRHQVDDLKTLKKMLNNIHRLDCIQYHELIESLRYVDGFNATWLMTKAAQPIFALAKNRVYRTTFQASERSAAGVNGSREEQESVTVTPILESNPKWKLLGEVLDEIDAYAKETKLINGRAVIFVRDENTAIQLRSLLCKGEKKMLADDFDHFLNQRSTRVFQNVLHASMKYTKENAGDGSNELQTTLTQLFGPEGTHRSNKFVIRRARNKENVPPDASKELATQNDSIGSDPHVKTEVNMAESQGFSGGNSEIFSVKSSQSGEEVEVLLTTVSFIPGYIQRFLENIQPSFVILYEPMLECIRQVELFKANHEALQLRLYFLCYENSVEEKRYMYSLQKEQEAFEALIREKETLIIHANQEGRIQEETESPILLGSELGNGRSLGVDRDSRLSVASLNRAKKVIVDMRELRSSLCVILHSSGMELLPMTLPIGDYILSPSICVERKSIPDLISSFSSGRLFNQVEKMTRHYKTPCLLLEFSENRSFSLATNAELDKQISTKSIIAKTVILTQQFPQLRLLWCRSPFETANLFLEMKKNEEEPNEQTAATMGLDDDEPENNSSLDVATIQVLRSLPGINYKNIHRVINSVGSIRELVHMSLPDLKNLLGPANGKILFEFANASAATFEDQLD